MRFIRKNGRVIPIREKSDGSRKQGVETTMHFVKVPTSAGSRFKSGAKTGAIVGGLFGLTSPRNAIANGIAAGAVTALTTGVANAAFGARTRTHMNITSVRKVSKRGKK